MNESNTYLQQLNSTDKKGRKKAIEHLLLSKNPTEFNLLLNSLVKKPSGNALVLCLTTLGQYGNPNSISGIIDSFDVFSDNEKKAALTTLLRLGAFEKCFPGAKPHPNVFDQLWVLLWSAKTEHLKKYLSMSPDKFKEELDFAWKTTAHWRKA